MSILEKKVTEKKIRKSFNLKKETISKLHEVSKDTKINMSEIVEQALNHLFNELEKEKK
jgi:post-segregation antitoxin (ccd killing protein)